MSGENEILELEKQRADALVAKDIPLLERLFDDDLVYIHRTGRIDTKLSYIEGLKKGKPEYRGFIYSNVKVRIYGDCAIVSGDVVIEGNTRADVRFTNVWSRTGSQWRNVHWVAVNRAV